MNSLEISKTQLYLLRRTRDFIKLAESRGLNVESSALCYFNSWSSCVGHAMMKYWCGGATELISLCMQFIKSVALIGMQSNYKITGNNVSKGEYSKLIVSWAKQSDFMPDGSYQDRYLGANSNDIDSAKWVLILQEGSPPAGLQENISLIFKNPEDLKFNLRFFFAEFYQKILASRWQWRNFLFSLSGATVFAEKISELVCQQLEIGKTNFLLMPYEAQPFQNKIISDFKKIDPTIKSVGYFHSVLPALPTDLIIRKGAPDILLVHGLGQREILCTHLGWPIDRVKKIKSLRYSLQDEGIFKDQIFLPYNFTSPKVLISSFEDYLCSSNEGSIKELKVRNHPLMGSSIRHLSLVKNIEELLFRYPERFATAPKGESISIFIGVTASMIECLERGLKVMQICTNPVFESHSKEIWSALFTIQRGPNTFIYQLKKNGGYIDFGAPSDNLKYIF